MSRDRTRTRDASVDSSSDEFDADFELGETQSEAREPPGSADAANGFRSRAAERAGEFFSPRLFIAALLVSAAGVFLTNTFLPLPGAGLLGIFGATFLFGLAVKQRRYAESAIAGGVAGAGSTLLDFAVIAFLGGLGVPLVGLMGLLGAVVGALGTYFGRDLRHGLTRDI